MFRREVDGAETRFRVVGLWGSGNVIAEQASVDAGEGCAEHASCTAWSMWDGHALFGPLRPSVVEKFPAFSFVIDAEDFVGRYASLGADCEAWLGDEVLGVGCEAACAHVTSVCLDRDETECLAECEGYPRSVIECLGSLEACEDEAGCNLEAWAEWRDP